MITFNANLLKSEDRLLGYPWCSIGYYLSAAAHRPQWMRVDRLPGEHGIGQDTPAGRQQFEQRLEARRLEPGDEESLKVFRRGWYIGSRAFRQEQLARMEGKLGEPYAGELRRETAEAKGERIIAEELQRLGWSQRELIIRRKNDAGKMAIAVRLRRAHPYLENRGLDIGAGIQPSVGSPLRRWAF